MINQVYAVTPTRTRQVLFPSTVTVAGEPLLVGTEPCINLDSYQANIGGATCYFDGGYSLTVVAKSSLSPSVNHTIKPGDPIYLKGGTLDATTNVTTGGTLCADSSGTLWGHLDPSEATITGGETNDAATVALGLS